MIGEETCHPTVRAMLAYARALARGSETTAAPPAPAGSGDRLFVLDRDERGRLRVRAFGDGLVQLFGRDLRGATFSSLLSQADHDLVSALVACCERAIAPGVVRAAAETVSARIVGLELILSPLAAMAGPGRYLGYIEPLAGAAALQGDRILRLKVGAVLTPFARSEPRLRLVVDRG
jgi:hypothetical protein